MPLPTLVKTWQISRNNSIPTLGSTLAHSRRVWKTIKDLMIGFASSPWTVRGSSNSVAAGMDNVDRWTADANLVWNGGGAHSWMVLRNTNIATNYELCIDLNNAFERAGSLIFSPSAGFTGGTTSARPTATDEIVMTNGAEIHKETDEQAYITAWQSTDGQAFRLCIWQAAAIRLFWLIEKPRNPRTGWTNPSITFMISGFGDFQPSHFQLYKTVGSGLARGRQGATTLELNFTGEASASGLLAGIAPTATQVNEFDSTWDFYPIGILSNTVSARGRNGILNDVWWAPTNLGQGDTAPNNAADRQFVKFGGIWLPWDPGGSTVPLMT
jgi:hypothetical protein